MKEKRMPFRQVCYAVSLMLIATVIIFNSCTKKDASPEPPVVQHKPFSQPDKFLITAVKGSDKNLGILINDPIGKMQYGLFGTKKPNGELDTLLLIVEADPQTGGWLSHEFNEDYTPSSTNTSTGHTIEYEDFDEGTKTGSVTIKETVSGRIIHKTGKIGFPDNVWNNWKRVKELNKNRPGFPPNWQSELAYVGSAFFGCVMGIAGLSTGNPIALGWGIYNTYQNCKSFAEAANNILNGQPAFGCITTKDNANALSGFAESISQGGSIGSLATSIIPAAINYVAQDGAAGQCKDEPGDEDPLGTGSGQGDPHIFTPDGLAYDFHGYGEFIAVKSVSDNFEVQVRQMQLAYIVAQATVNRAIAVQTGEDIVCVVADPAKLYINNIPHDLNFQAIELKQGASVKRIQEGSFPVIVIQSKNGDKVKVRLNAGLNASYFDYKIELAKNRAGKVKGLMGNADGDKNNDLQLGNGEVVDYVFDKIYPGFANAWRISQANSLFYYEAGKNTDSYTKKDFPSAPPEITPQKLTWAENICKNAGITTQPALCNCTLDVALTDDPVFAANALWDQHTWPQADQPFDMPHIAMQGEAILLDGRIRLTPASVFTSGQAFYTQALTGNFETEFSFRIPYSSNGGADGLALLIAKEIPQLKPNSYPGFDGRLGYQGVPASLAVEFDTWLDQGENNNHVAIHTKGALPNSTEQSAAVAYNPNIPEIQGGAIHKVKVKYAAGKVSVWLNGTLVLEYSVNLFTALGLADKFYIGLVSSTRGSFEEHSIHEWIVKPL